MKNPSKAQGKILRDYGRGDAPYRYAAIDRNSDFVESRGRSSLAASGGFAFVRSEL